MAIELYFAFTGRMYGAGRIFNPSEIYSMQKEFWINRLKIIGVYAKCTRYHAVSLFAGQEYNDIRF